MRRDPAGRVPRILGVSSESNLVVEDDVDRAARVVLAEGGHGDRLVNDTLMHSMKQANNMRSLIETNLASKGGVAVHEDGHDSLANGVTARDELRLDLTSNQRIDGLEVRRIGGQAQVDLKHG